jgi:hypothetical protein
VTPAALITAIGLMTSCGDDKKKKTFDFGAPKIAQIVDATAPTGLKGSSANLALAPDCGSFNPNSPATGGWQLMDNYLSYLTCATFRKNANVEGPAYFRYWVDVLDQAMTETNNRLAGAADSLPACVTADPVVKTFTFRVEKSSGTDTVNMDMKLNCFENQVGGSGSQVMAFGKDATHFYLMYLTKDADTLGTTGQGHRIVMAKADVAGNEADIWFIGNSYQGGQSVVPADKISTVANRVMANKTTGAFTYAIAESVIGLTKQSNFIRSDGTNFYFKGQTSLPSNGGTTSVQDIVDGNGANEFCFGASDLSTKTLATCQTTNLDDVPTDFGMSEAPRSKANVNFFSELKADVTSILNTDFAAAGIGRFGDGTVQ